MTLPRARALAALLVATAAAMGACSDDAGGPAPGPDAGAEIDAGPREHLSVPATDGSYDVPYSISISGRGSRSVGAISIDGGFGTISIEGTPLPIAIYEKQPWPEFGYTLYQALAVAGDRWFALWFYCQPNGLAYIYIEGTDGTPLTLVDSTGECTESDVPSTIAASFPAVDLIAPRVDDGFVVSGQDVSLDGAAPGWVRVGSSELAVYVFEHIDCTLDCGADGWHELHALLWDPERRWLCFGIFYLHTDHQQPVFLTYTFSLPVLQDPIGSVEFPDATWTPP